MVDPVGWPDRDLVDALLDILYPPGVRQNSRGPSIPTRIGRGGRS
ncbi:hypothetical protein ACFO5X_17930 [Seohaeicola nanhaiensis]|uniref:Transposase n=1 Tax=Seohaeicola nanhaiensis TaxID=1387282 RepID=A0ABV9KKD9_9RHOB